MSQIKVYGRLRPLLKRASRYEDLSVSSDSIKISIGDKKVEKFAGSPYHERLFKFTRVFNENSTQEDVFNCVAVEMIDRFLEGFNGTLFAYGQTASGKTHTIEGGARQFHERGIIPRTISYIYSALESRKQSSSSPDHQEDREGELSTIHISYLEIYQDTGYDLLSPGTRNEGMMTSLPKVSVLEGPNGEAHVRHLSVHLASNEEVALSLLFQGSTCRRVAETTMNLSSSRSHAIFTILLTSQKPGSEVRIRSKLNLVDLAGSERVYKTCATGQVLQEAKHINLSLHHLEHVIVVLQKHALSIGKNGGRSATPSVSTETVSSCASPQPSSPQFVPYRNSLLTMILRDSLGGNCITAMVANLSLDEANILETISTCRFSQRVACISNKATRNEELDDEVVIRMLKKRVQELQREMEEMKAAASTNERVSNFCNKNNSLVALTDEQKKKCHKVLYDFLHGKITNPVNEGINSPTLFNEALVILKDVITHTVKENKRFKQKEKLKRKMVDKSLQVSPVKEQHSSMATPPWLRHNVLSPCITRTQGGTATISTSPQSQLSSGFISLKDDELQTDSSHYCIDYPTSVPCTAVITNKQHAISKTAHHGTTTVYKSSLSKTTSLSPTPTIVENTQSDNCKQRLPDSASGGTNLKIAMAPDELKREQQSAQQQYREVLPSASGGNNRFPPSNQRSAAGQSKLSIKSMHTKVSPPPQKDDSSKEQVQSRQDLIKKVNSLDHEVLVNTIRFDLESISAKLASQHAKVLRMQQAGVSLDELITEKKVEQQLKLKMDKLSGNLEQLKNRSDIPVAMSQSGIRDSNMIVKDTGSHQSRIGEDAQDLRIAQLQKQLELKEAATMRRLLTLKVELQSRNSVTATNEPALAVVGGLQNDSHPEISSVVSQHGRMTRNVEDYKLHRSNEKHLVAVLTNKTELEPSKTKAYQESTETNQKPSLKSTPTKSFVVQPNSERLYSKELHKHKSRVTQIRQCIRAAVIIQRAWRRYKKKTFLK